MLKIAFIRYYRIHDKSKYGVSITQSFQLMCLNTKKVHACKVDLSEILKFNPHRNKFMYKYLSITIYKS